MYITQSKQKNKYIKMSCDGQSNNVKHTTLLPRKLKDKSHWTQASLAYLMSSSIAWVIYDLS